MLKCMSLDFGGMPGFLKRTDEKVGTQNLHTEKPLAPERFETMTLLL